MLLRVFSWAVQMDSTEEKIKFTIQLYPDQIQVLKTMHRSGRRATAAIAVLERAIEEHQKASKS
ncbi:hypothetical protein [Leptolyngbya sp. GGD]|uniref:hypothetical protein n=1 Tax=Leptolyngbya sp. GGD TaxID=2997907 RepID=UPI00227BE4A5|nr:hypothetical protein [Leptolyngbya sp. GGD]MCY6492104.1 hypothetical protein [Leptolyngbya sp. GGD]